MSDRSLLAYVFNRVAAAPLDRLNAALTCDRRRVMTSIN